MHHQRYNYERALNLSILSISGPGKFPRVESNYDHRKRKLASDYTLKGGLPSTPI